MRFLPTNYALNLRSRSAACKGSSPGTAGPFASHSAMSTRDTPKAALASIQSAMDNLNNAIDDTHPEGCECDICHAADALDAILMMQPPPAIPAGLFP